jgi:hypothetical protein
VNKTLKQTGKEVLDRKQRMFHVPEMATDRPVISLFSGAMGLDLGLEAVGFRTAVALEKNMVAVETIRLNKGEHFPVIDDPIEDVETEDILDLADLEPVHVILVTQACRNTRRAFCCLGLAEEYTVGSNIKSTNIRS